MRNDAEFRLQCALVQHLRLQAPRDCYWKAVPNGEARSPRTGARLKAAGVKPGAADLEFLFRGRFLALELKVPGGRQSPAQRLTEQMVRDAGGIYVVATGIDEALAALREFGILPASYSYEPSSRRQLSLMEAG